MTNEQLAREAVRKALEGRSVSPQGFRAVTPTSPEHSAVLSDLARRIDDE